MLRTLLSFRWALLTLVLLVVIAGCLLAAWWQFERTSQELTLDEAAVAERVPLSDLVEPGAAMPVAGIGRQVSLAGVWQPEYGVLVRDRESDSGEAGYWALSSVSTGHGATVPVLLGWVPDARFTFPRGEVVIEGRLQTEENFYPDAVVHASRPLVTITHEGLLAHWDDRVSPGDLTPGFVATTAAAPGIPAIELVRPVIGENPGVGFPVRNFAYGLQWIVFALVAIVIWGWWLRQESRPAADEAALAQDHDRVNVGG